MASWESDDQFKRKKLSFNQLTRDEQLAAAFYPQNASPEDRQEMRNILSKEGWKGEGQKLIPDHVRGSCSPLGNQAVQQRKK